MKMRNAMLNTFCKRLIVGILFLVMVQAIVSSPLSARGRSRNTAPAEPAATETPADSSSSSSDSSSSSSSSGDAAVPPSAAVPEPVPQVITEQQSISQADLSNIASETGLGTTALSTDYSSQHVVSTRSMVSQTGNCTTWYLMYTRTEDVMKTLTAMFEQDINSGDIKIADNPVTNAIIIRMKDPASPILTDILDTIRSLDFRPGQVLIDVLVVELKVDDKDLFNFELKGLGRSPFGMSNTQSSVGLDHGTGDLADPTIVSSGFKALITSQNKLKLFLNAAKSKDRVNIISSPHIVAANHRKATFKIGDKIPIITSVRPSDAGPIKTFEIKEVGIELSVTPHINRSAEIDMEILQTINNLSSYNEAQGTAQMTNREVQTNITVSNGETIILGGFIEERKSEIESKIPLLSSIPGIGRAFTKRDNKKSKTEILVFLTPRLLDTLEDARNATQLRTEKSSHKDRLVQLIKERQTARPPAPANQEILIDRASRDWKYDFDTQQTDVVAWQIPPSLDPASLKLNRVGACPFGYGASKRLNPPFIRTLLKPSDGFIFQKEFTVADPAKYKSVLLNVASNNAAAVYINGTLVDEDPMVKLKDGHDYDYWNRSIDKINTGVLKPGANTITVILANDKTTTDGYFDMMLIGAF
jgi:type II secretory pathway component GspD/PulD (secretin)